MAINSSRPFNYIVTSPNWNELADAVNRAAPALEVTIGSLDGNGSISLPTGEETDINLAVSAGTMDVNGCSVPDRYPWPLYIVITDAGTYTLKHEDATETTPAKRFRLPGNTDLVLTIGMGVLLRYKSVPVGARWCAVVSA